MARRGEAKYDRAAQNAARALLERASAPESDEGTLAKALYRYVGPSRSTLDRWQDKRDQVRTQVQLLGVHGAIRRWLWEHDRLPDNLAVLGLGRQAVDPFTGQLLVYRRAPDGATYDFSSAGPPRRDEEGNVLPNEREPITVPYRRPSAAPPTP